MVPEKAETKVECFVCFYRFNCCLIFSQKDHFGTTSLHGGGEVRAGKGRGIIEQPRDGTRGVQEGSTVSIFLKAIFQSADIISSSKSRIWDVLQNTNATKFYELYPLRCNMACHPHTPKTFRCKAKPQQSKIQMSFIQRFS